jgi:transcription elongation GreA/GreB family factor
MDKSALIRSIVLQLEADLAMQTAAAHASKAEATDEESRSEDKYDMRSQSAAYLAAGQAKLASDLLDAIAAWNSLTPKAFEPGQAIASGALVTLEAEGRSAAYLMGPSSGGLEASDGSSTATVVTAASPLGRQLLGRRAGDDVKIADHLGPVIHRVSSVR